MGWWWVGDVRGTCAVHVIVVTQTTHYNHNPRQHTQPTTTTTQHTPTNDIPIVTTRLQHDNTHSDTRQQTQYIRQRPTHTTPQHRTYTRHTDLQQHTPTRDTDKHTQDNTTDPFNQPTNTDRDRTRTHITNTLTATHVISGASYCVNVWWCYTPFDMCHTNTDFDEVHLTRILMQNEAAEVPI